MSSTLKWGIIGTGKIASDFVTALGYVQGAQVVAVGSSRIESANEFGNKFNIAKRYGSYEEVAKDNEVEAVYVSVLNPGHRDAALFGLRNKKHVLCEKPLTLNSKEAKEIIEEAKKNDVLLMEAMWSRFFPGFDKIRELLKSNALGDIINVSANFGFKNSVKPRLIEPELGGGALLDIGIYIVSLASFVFRGEAPSKIIAIGETTEKGIDTEVAITLKYKQNEIAQLFCTILSVTPCEAVISGTEGRIKIHAPFWCPTMITVTKDGKDEDFSFPLPQLKESDQYNFRNSIGLKYEAEHFQQLVHQGKKSSDLMPIEESLIIMQTLDEIRKQIGVVYPMEK